MSRPRVHRVLGFFPFIFCCPTPHPLATHTHIPCSAYILDNTRNDLSPPWEKAKDFRHSLKTNTVKWRFCSHIPSASLPLPPVTPQTSKWPTGAEKESLSEQHLFSLCSYSPPEAPSGCSSCRQICIQEDRWQLQKPRWKVTRQTLWHQENGG